MKKIAVLAGGIGGARFIRGLQTHLAKAKIAAEVTVIVNTGDDMWLTGLRVCPDLDTVMYTLGGGINEEQGWGRQEETTRAAAEIHAYGRGKSWFTLGDRDLATHIVRTDLLSSGLTLSEATEFLCARWKPGARLLPMSDQPMETHVRLAEDIDGFTVGDLMHFEEWWVRYRAQVAVSEFERVGSDEAVAAPGVVEAIAEADLVILPPSNPIVSVGTILAVPGVRSAIQSTTATVVGVSPVIGGSPVRGMADVCLSVVGVETSAGGVAAHYGSRASGGLLDAWLVDEVDAEVVSRLTSSNILTAAVPLWMRDVQSSAAIAAEVLAISSRV